MAFPGVIGVVALIIMALGSLIGHAALKADNDRAWVIYGCMPVGAGFILFALAVAWNVL